jgi:hypothetical protein
MPVISADSALGKFIWSATDPSCDRDFEGYADYAWSYVVGIQ